MTILLRIGLTPLAYALVAKAQARFGDWIGGRLIGLPVTTGPFLLTVCLTASRATAAHAAAGVTTGQMAVVVFCGAYAWLARQLEPLRATVASLVLALTAVLGLSSFSGAWTAAAAVWAVITASLLLWPWAAQPVPASAGAAGALPAGAVPAGAAPAGAVPADASTDTDMGTGTDARAPILTRAVISTCVVATMSTLVPILGARPAGVLSSAPVLLSIILPSTHRSSGAAGAAAVARGTIVSMAATVAFSAVLASCLPQMGVASALLLAAGVLAALLLTTPLVDRALAQAGSALGRPEAVL